MIKLTDKKAVGLRLKQLRKRAGLSQLELALMLTDSGYVTISKIERGINNLALIHMVKMCEIFGITPNEFLRWDEFSYKNTQTFNGHNRD